MQNMENLYFRGATAPKNCKAQVRIQDFFSGGAKSSVFGKVARENFCAPPPWPGVCEFGREFSGPPLTTFYEGQSQIFSV